ncbi:MAG: FG-GAP-like repeat-containing protein, partial [Candidatus Eisenbacteria bacterium]
MLRHRLLKETVELSWDASGDSLLYGYDVYRSDELAGSYSMIGMVDGYSRYVDDGLLHEESYYYYVSARDSMGNTSAPSETLEVWTGPPCLTGWPAELRGAAPSSPVSGDATHDGHREIFVGSKGLEMAGFNRDGVTLAGYPYEGKCEVWSSPALVDLDNDGTLECVFGEGQANNGPHCKRIVALNHDGSFVSPQNNPGLPPGSPGWPQVVGDKIRSSPTAYDLDGDGYLEIIVGLEPNPAADMTTAVYAFRYDGSPYLGTTVFAETKGGHWATPCVYDLDGSGRPEVIVCDKKGDLYIWEYDGTAYLADTTGLVYSTGSSFLSSPVVGDIDDDGLPEIVAITTSGKVLAWNHDGTQVTGDDPVIATISSTAWASPALADFDSDGKLEIVAGFGGQPANLALLRWDGSPYGDDEVILTWGHSLGYSSPVVADVDNDGELEIVTCSSDGYILGVETDGTFARGYPWKLDEYIFSSPLIDDLDGDGDMDLAVSGYDACLHVWDLASPYSPENVPWGMFQHDRYHTGSFDFKVPADVTAPTHAIAVFQNPVLDKVMDIYVVPREQLADQPVLWVGSALGSDTLDVTAVPGEGRIFRAHHTAEPAAAETVYVTATDVYGNSGTDLRVITYSGFVGNGLMVRSHDTRFEATARIASGAPVLALFPVDRDYLTPRGSDGTVDIEEVAYNLCVLGKGAQELSLSMSAGLDPDVEIYRFEDGWHRVAGQRKDGDRIFVGDAEPGIYAMGRGRPDRLQNLLVSDAAPNPFRDRCTIMLGVSRRVEVSVSIYDVRGRLVRSVHNGPVDGTARIDWDGTDTSGRTVSSGIYFIRAQAGSVVAAKKVILVR